MEKVYKTMQRTGAFSIVIGIVVLITGLTVGIGSIICGGLLLKRKGDFKKKQFLFCKGQKLLFFQKGNK